MIRTGVILIGQIPILQNELYIVEHDYLNSMYESYRSDGKNRCVIMRKQGLDVEVSCTMLPSLVPFDFSVIERPLRELWRFALSWLELSFQYSKLVKISVSCELRQDDQRHTVLARCSRRH